jgi:ParB-like chromosome segregation protein Spo0J
MGRAMTDTKPEKYQLLPELRPEEFEALKQDIAERGVVVPVVVDEFGAILDGHNRARACRELGINDYPVEVRSGLSEADKRVFARKLNVLRRHLTRDQVRQLIGDQLRDPPEWADRRIGRELGVDHKTVGAVRAELGSIGEIPQLEKTVGDDGKARPAQPSRKARQSRKARPAIEDWDEDDDDDDDLVEDFGDEPESDRARLRRERREDRELAAWGGSREKTAKFEHAIGLIKHGVDPNSEEVQKLFLEAAGTVIKSAPGGGGYRVFAHCTEAGERDWHLFILFLSKEWNWWPEYAAQHVEYLSQKQFMDPDEWLGEEGRRFRKQPASGKEPSDEFKRAWAAFKEANSGRSQVEINAEIETIYKERGPVSEASAPAKRKRRKPAPERAA